MYAAYISISLAYVNLIFVKFPKKFTIYFVNNCIFFVKKLGWEGAIILILSLVCQKSYGDEFFGKFVMKFSNAWLSADERCVKRNFFSISHENKSGKHKRKLAERDRLLNERGNEENSEIENGQEQRFELDYSDVGDEDA